jgi:AcrR family transcriptional regulator
MPATQAYRSRRRSSRTEQTRERITAAVRALLEDGTFHESTVEQVAERAGVSRATVYQHFPSRLDLVDTICDTFAANPALVELRDIVLLEDVDQALAGTIANCVRIWSSEDRVLRQLYGVVAIDPAARDFVDRQRADRRSELERLVANLRRAGKLRAGAEARRALVFLLVLTSYETFREQREAGLGDAQIIQLLQSAATTLIA